ncbi:unnamed protein product [Cochlearia groenlandica]
MFKDYLLMVFAEMCSLRFQDMTKKRRSMGLSLTRYQGSSANVRAKVKRGFKRQLTRKLSSLYQGGDCWLLIQLEDLGINLLELEEEE